MAKRWLCVGKVGLGFEFLATRLGPKRQIWCTLSSRLAVATAKTTSVPHVSFYDSEGCSGCSHYGPFAMPKLMQAFTRVCVALCHQSIEDRKGLGQHLGQGPGPENSNAKLLLKGKLLQGATKKQILPVCECNYLTGLELLPPTANICCHHNHTSVFTRKDS